MSAARWLEQPSEHPAALLSSPAAQRVPCRAAGGFTGSRCPPSPSPEHRHEQHSGPSWSAWGQDPAGLSSVLPLQPQPRPQTSPQHFQPSPLLCTACPRATSSPCTRVSAPPATIAAGPVAMAPPGCWMEEAEARLLNPLSGTTQPPPDGPWQQFLDSPVLTASSTKLQDELALAARAKLCPPSPVSPLGALGQHCLICVSREP